MKKYLIFAILLLWIGPSLVRAQNRHALLIGIGQYEDVRWSRIHGDTDLDYARELVGMNGFSDIRMLRNAVATKQAIVSAFGALEEDCRAGDKVYVHFSGHGQQITDLDGDEMNGYDEAWIPYDAKPSFAKGVYEGENHLVDDEVNRMLARIKRKIGPSGRILVVVDACHSGTSTREPGDTTVARGIDKKFEIPGKKARRKSPAEENWITISACQSYQVNWEMTDPAVGKLTWCLYRLRSHLGSLSNQSLKASILRIMQENPGPLGQTPEMTGCTDTESVKDLFQ